MEKKENLPNERKFNRQENYSIILANSEKDLKNICKNANVVEGLAVIGHKTTESKELIAEWALKNV